MSSSRDSKTIGDSLEETKEYHRRYLYAVNSPVRRGILKALKDGDATVEVLTSRTGLDPKTLEWHLNILEHGFCIEREVRQGTNFYRLTREGKVVDFMDR
jgi:DNA-binding transcriptional ArsR family regulator